MISEFEKLGLAPPLVSAVEQLGFTKPTPIQLAAIPALLEGRNVVGQAQTGTGKTAAFALPLLQKIEHRKGAIQALILAPTRELAIQVTEAITRMAIHTGLRIMSVYGGQAYHIQIRQLENGVDVVVGTPGRLIDLTDKKLLDLSQVRYLVLDEADEMLEMGFIEDVETILAQIPAERQIALFSATLPAPVRKLADRYVSSPHQIRIDPTRLTVAETEQRYCRVREEDKLAALTRLLEVEEVSSALIFARTKARAQDLADELIRRGYPAASLHGDLNQSRREFVLNRFRERKITLLVATDVAARGLDIEEMSHVFNYDVPGDPEDYIHRIGRTGRAGKKGIAITFVTPRERSRLREIEAFTHQAMLECAIPTRDQIIARRDDRFLEKLTEHLGSAKISRERAMIARLSETSFDLVEIAAAAIRLARQGEVDMPLEEISIPFPEPKYERKNRRAGKIEVSLPAGAFSSPRRPSGSKTGDRHPQKIGGSWDRTWPSSTEAQPNWKKGRQEPGMVRLRMNLGNENGLRPGDVVGAIAGEVGIPGKAIGEIDIHHDFTFVDVSEKHVRQVLSQSTGQYLLRGKPVLLTLAS
jgi:ATP-dependent RNA helicase DeaD